MRRFPSGIAVLTLRRPFGVTLASLASVSLDPPLVGVAIGLDTQAHELIREEGGFALSLLAGDQEDLAQHFARSVPPIAQWEGIAARDGPRGPLLDGATGWLACGLWAQYPAGDHSFFLGEVESVELGRRGEGLVYREGGYHSA
jgi:flavin reductase (DIM6/NTAB) family NADH-FMN oxidoreductase RutF